MKALVALLGCAACMVTPQRAHVVTLPPAPPPGPWLTLRDAIDGCARDHGLAGEVRVRIAIDPDGGPGSVTSVYGDAFDVCVGRAIARARYRAYAGRTIDVPHHVGPG